MTEARAGSSLTQHARLFDAGAHVVAAAFVDGAPALALADGLVLIGEPDEQKRVAAHPDASILTATSDGKTLLTGGDDGRVVAVRAAGSHEDVADEKGKWIDALALRGKAYAWSAGKQVRARDESGVVRTWSAPTTARGLAFQPKGFRLAATHYNGATLWFPKVEGTPQTLEWKGAHLDATFSPDGRFLVTSMQENALHGWRIQDSRNMRMTGYPAKTRSLSWSHDGQWLATSGADAAVIWPFKDKDGPMGKAPHPKALVVAIGYADGLVLLTRLADAAEILVRHPGDGAVSALGWNATGSQLLFGLESGVAGLLSLPA
jgi:WD40 repeat protein